MKTTLKILIKASWHIYFFESSISIFQEISLNLTVPLDPESWHQSRSRILIFHIRDLCYLFLNEAIFYQIKPSHFLAKYYLVVSVFCWRYRHRRSLILSSIFMFIYNEYYWIIGSCWRWQKVRRSIEIFVGREFFREICWEQSLHFWCSISQFCWYLP